MMFTKNKWDWAIEVAKLALDSKKLIPGYCPSCVIGSYLCYFYSQDFTTDEKKWREKTGLKSETYQWADLVTEYREITETAQLIRLFKEIHTGFLFTLPEVAEIEEEFERLCGELEEGEEINEGDFMDFIEYLETKKAVDL